MKVSSPLEHSVIIADEVKCFPVTSLFFFTALTCFGIRRRGRSLRDVTKETTQGGVKGDAAWDERGVHPEQMQKV